MGLVYGDKNEAVSCMNNLIGSRLYCCFKCRNVIAIQDDIVDKNFWSGNGRAYLFSQTMNVVEGPALDREMITGIHMIADVFCSDCGEVLGWKYAKAYHGRNMFKQGKTALKKSQIDKLANPPFH